MRASIALAWLLFAVWSVWLLSLQGLVARAGAGAWTPDLGLILLLSLQARLRPEDLIPAALLAAFARASISIEPPAAICAGTLAAAGLARGTRSVLHVASRLPSALLAGLAALVFTAWLRLVGQVRLGGPEAVDALAIAAAALPTACASAAVAWLADPLLAGLPGLTPLRKRRSWLGAVSDPS